MRKWYRNSSYTLHNTDAFEWLKSQRANSFHAVVTDPPFGVLEYSASQITKRRSGRGGIWRLPNAFDGAKRQAMPRFTVLDDHDRDARVAVSGLASCCSSVLHGRLRVSWPDSSYCENAAWW